MFIRFEKENGDTIITLSMGEKTEKFDYLSFRNYLFLGKNLEGISFSDDFLEEEKIKLKKMIENIEKTAVKKGDLAK